MTVVPGAETGIQVRIETQRNPVADEVSALRVETAV
jgi:hypothetical protein